MERFGFIGGRLVQMIPVVLGVTIVTFFILRLIPGDPVVVMLGSHYTPKEAAALRAALGLNRPLWEQYLIIMNNLVHVNLGDSVNYRLPVTALVGNTGWVQFHVDLVGPVLRMTVQPEDVPPCPGDEGGRSGQAA